MSTHQTQALAESSRVGEENTIRSEWKTLRAVFPRFASLPEERGHCVKSETLKCHGLDWQIQLFPGGDRTSKEDQKYVSIYLACLSVKGFEVNASANLRVVPPTMQTQNLFVPASTTCIDSGPPVLSMKLSWKDGANSWGFDNYALRSCLIDKYLLEGNLTIEFSVQVVLDMDCWTQPAWMTRARRVEGQLNACIVAMTQRYFPLKQDMLKLLDNNTADVTIEVGGGSEAESGEMQTFLAHRLILSARCPALNALVKDQNEGSSCPICIDDVNPNLFRIILRYIYGGGIPAKGALKKEARAIIRAANRFGCTGLKHAAEAELASNNCIKTENAVELILFADKNNCALLKETVLDYFVANAESVMASTGYELVKQSPTIMGEMMAAMAASAAASKKRPVTPGSDGKDYKRMRVATLRNKLYTKGLDVDGSKEMLADRLQTAETESEAAETLS